MKKQAPENMFIKINCVCKKTTEQRIYVFRLKWSQSVDGMYVHVLMRIAALLSQLFTIR